MQFPYFPGTAIVSIAFASIIGLVPLDGGKTYSTTGGDTAQAWTSAQGTILFQEVDPATLQPTLGTINETQSPIFHALWYNNDDPLVPYTPPNVMAVPSVAPTSAPTVAPTAVPTVAPTAVPTIAPSTVPAVGS